MRLNLQDVDGVDEKMEMRDPTCAESRGEKGDGVNLLDIETDHAVPLGFNQFAGVAKLVVAGNDGAINNRRGGQFGFQVIRDHAALEHIGQAGRSAVALHPNDLTLIRIQEFLPQAGGGGMRPISTDGLQVEPTPINQLGINNFERRVAVERFGIGERQVVPLESDGGVRPWQLSQCWR